MLLLIIHMTHSALHGREPVPTHQKLGVRGVAVQLHGAEGAGVGEARGLEVVAGAEAVGVEVFGGGWGAGEAVGGGRAAVVGSAVGGECPGGGFGAALCGLGAAAGGAQPVEEGGGGL